MSLYDFGLDYLIENAPQFNIKDPEIGIVTATDSNTFIGVKTLYLSIKNKINFLCYDIGMTSEQLSWCEANELSVIKFNVHIPLIDKWQTYVKPFIVQVSPYNYTIWIDSDCIVSGDLSVSSLIKNKQTFFTRHWIDSKHLRKNSRVLYEIYPVTGDSELINAGVFAINKTIDADILLEWIFMVNNTLTEEIIRSYVVNWDEGSLIWAIRKTNKGNKIIDEDSKYNLFCEFIGDTLAPLDTNNFYDRPIKQFENYKLPSKFFKQVLECKGFICHFSTCMANGKKYWNRWN